MKSQYTSIINRSKLLLTVITLLVTTIGYGQTTITLQPDSALGKDATIFTIFPDTNFGDYPNFNLEAWTSGGSPWSSRSITQFDMSGLPANIVITSAYLSLYYAPQSDGDEHSTMNGSNSFVIQRVTSNWDEYTITWNNQPSVTNINEVVLPASVSSTQDYLDIDLTAMVQDMYNSPSTSFGFMSRLETEINYRRMVFASSDYSNAIKHPKLVISYNDLTSVEDLSVLQSFNAWPNPTRNELHIESTHANSLRIVDLLGQTVYFTEDNECMKTVDVSSFPRGVIFVQMSFLDGIRTKRIAIK